MKRRKMNPVDVFDIENLPDVPFRRVLYFLSVKETRNLRLLSKWFERKITFLRKSIFKKFHLQGMNGITKLNSVENSRTLSVAMTKLLAPENLEINFHGKWNSTMRQISLDYKDNITCLEIDVCGNEILLLKPSFKFESLESLTLDGFCCKHDRVEVCEAMLDKHANNLKSLKLEWLNKTLRVPDLPVLDSLSLNCVEKEGAWIILEQSKLTITSLKIYATNMESQSFNYNESKNSAVYQIPNIKHLSMICSNAFQFVVFNANHLVSLDLSFVEGIPEDFIWPQFHNLKELNIDYPKCLPLLFKCRQKLELVIIIDIPNYDDEYASVVLPKVTDLYLNNQNITISNKIFSSNHKGIEFLFLSQIDLSTLDSGIKMERMRNVVLGYNNPVYTAQDRERLVVMCPNAEVVILKEENKGEIRDMVKSRSKQRNFLMSVDLTNSLDENGY